MTDEKPLPIEPELVAEFVLKAHGDLGVVKQLLEQEPAIVNASWDWGGGDWETALGAAAHVGRRDIAEYLLEHGARMDVFAATMLGETEIVRAMLDAQPSLREARGPHGIPLISHAEAGGEQARAVLDLLGSAAVA
ncbi:MAG: ankyrin repeat domain-containing protein [Actinobacteria bacterium]|nr:MAG: ankyrin repeat domain-containing protein [Actinomycetota bacterium]